VGTHARRAVDDDSALAEGVETVAEVVFAEAALAERALRAGVRAAAFVAAEAGAVALADAFPVAEMLLEVVELAAAGGVDANSLVVTHDVAVGGAERASTILAGVDRWLLAAVAEPAPARAQLAGDHHPTVPPAGHRDTSGGRLPTGCAFTRARHSANVAGALHGGGPG
jgi:hypothetical protein